MPGTHSHRLACCLWIITSSQVLASSIPFESRDLAWHTAQPEQVSCHWAAGISDQISDGAAYFDEAKNLRESLQTQGLDVKFSTTQFYQGITAGGLDRDFRYGGRNDLLMKIDGAQAGLWQGLFIDLHTETRYGQAINGDTGAISAPNSSMLFPLPGETTTDLTNFTVTQALSEQCLVMAGKINLLDAYVNPLAAGRGNTQFMNLSLIFPPIYGRTVPYSTLGAGVIFLKGPDPVFSFFVLDAGGEPNRSGFEDFFGEGVTLDAQVSIPVQFDGRKGHQQLAAVWSNRSVTALDQTQFLNSLPEGGVPLAEENNSWALHYSFDQQVYVDPCDPRRSWGVFGQASLSDGNPNPIRWYVSTGVGGSSPWRSRPEDTFGIGYFWFQTSSALKETLAPILPIGNEQGAEFYYNVAVKPWCHVTPNLQILEPSNKTADTAVLVGLRTHIQF